MARHRRGRHGPSHRRVLAAGLAVGVVLGGGLVAAAAIPLAKGPPALALVIPAAPAPSAPPSLPFPPIGESAVAVPSLGVFEAPGDQSPVPIASLTKLMTAYVTLRELPLQPDEAGPTITVTASDVAEYHADLRADQSCVAVAAGEVLTERNLLDGLLVHSANNYATMLARMVAGSTPAMVVEMNQAAQSLGLTTTTYADVSGYDPSSRSSASDQVRLAVVLMGNATFAAIVRQTSVVLPVAGVVTTFTPFLGLPGVVGIKTGYTSEAGGCDVMAFQRHIAGRRVLVVAGVLGQYSKVVRPLLAAGRAALALASGTARRIRPWKVAVVGAPIGSIGWPTAAVDVVPRRTVVLPVFPGVPARSVTTDRPWSSNALASGQHVATIAVQSGSYRAVIPVTTAAALTRPSLWQRLR